MRKESRREDASKLKFGSWQAERELGAGGFGTVYLCKGPNGQRAAIKIISGAEKSSADYSSYLRRFESELKILLKLDSPFTARVLDADISADTPWMATQYIAGDSLSEEIMHEGPLGEEYWWRLAADTLQGLSAAHAKGIIHRDVKLSNIMRSARHSVIIDFGISQVSGSAQNTIGPSPLTPPYASPEQILGQTLQTSTDIFSLGITLYQAGTGKNPFGSYRDMDKLVGGIVTGKADLSGVSPEQESLLRKMLQREPKSRISAAAALTIAQSMISPSAKVIPQGAAKRDAKVEPGNVRVVQPKRNEKSIARKDPFAYKPRQNSIVSSPVIRDWRAVEIEILNLLVKARKSKFIISFVTPSRSDLYVQGFYESENYLVLEAASPETAQLGLTVEQHRSILRLEWEPPSQGLPNYIKFLDQEESKKPKAAALITSLLKNGYGLNAIDIKLA